MAGAPRSRDLWATVNVCDTPGKPDRIGVRASMPGTGRRGDMLMRFRVQYFDDGTWRQVSGAVTPWLRAGSSRYRTREAGINFRIDPPASPDVLVLRGRVEFRWTERRGGSTRIVMRARANTKGGHPDTLGSDPPGFSAGLCELR